MVTTAVRTNVLVVDDDVLICKTLARLLSRCGYCASALENGREALAFLLTCQPTLVFLDVMMPDISGFDILKAIRASDHCKHVIVLMYSALSDQENIRHAMELGAADYIVKGSLSFDQILTMVKKHAPQLGDGNC